MAWTTRTIYIDRETNEVLDKKDLDKLNFEIKDKETIYQKIHETHTERIIIYKCGKRYQFKLDL